MSNEELEELKLTAQQDVVGNIREMESLNNKQVDSATRLVKMNHPLSKIEVWRALPFLAYMAKFLPSSSDQTEDEY